MSAWGRADPEAYRRLPLRAHAVLADAPLHDVWFVHLPGGGEGRTVEDLRALVPGLRISMRRQVAVRALFGLRHLLGQLFQWDAEREIPDHVSFRQCLSAQDRRESRRAPGTPDGPFSILYLHPREGATEIRNATVHAALVLALEPDGRDYRLLWAIHTRRVSWLTAPYMAMIDPFRRWVVYPAVLRHLRRAWQAAYAPDA